MIVRTAVAAAALLAGSGCWDANLPDAGVGGASGALDAAASGGRPAAGPDLGATGGRSTSSGALVWVGIQDSTQGIGAGQAGAGADIDAVGWSCSGDNISYGVQVDAEHMQDQAKLAAPDNMAVSLGLGGELFVRTGATDLSGCAVTVAELRDSVDDRFVVFGCSEPFDLNGKCGPPSFSGADGETKTGTIRPR